VSKTKTYRILAIEDDQEAFKLLKVALRHMPLEIVNAPTGKEAIDFLSKEVPDLMFMDIDLPDMHGWKVLEHFKGTGRLTNVPVIVLTAHKEPVHRVIGSLQSIAVYLNKPFKPAELHVHVQQLLHL
jgi:DNA-binding response OmpR family regulator